MKNKPYILPIIIVLLLVSCQKLDQEIITTTTYEQVTATYNYTRSRGMAVYSTLRNGFNYMGEAMMASVTDESEHTLETASVQKFNTGAVNALDNPDDVWGLYYQGIRRANQFLVSSDDVNLDLYKFDPSQQQTYATFLAEIENWKYEVRFLRAYFYFELVKRYGGVPILTEAVNLDADIQAFKRNSLAECLQFIISECEATAKHLPRKYPDTDLGRATRVAAMALRSRVMLYAASDLYNTASWTNGYAHPELVTLSGDRQERWQQAADAAKAAIDSAVIAGVTLSSTYNAMFGTNTFTNSEVIFCRRNGNSNTFEKTNIPVGYQLGLGRTTPSQNLVDAYEVKVNSTTAVPFDWSNPDHAGNPYSNRDPRLGFTIFRNGNTIKGRALETFIGGLDGRPKDQATKTGYYISKYVNVNLDLLLNATSNHAWVFFRLGELYLNYAEALNEADPGNADIKLYVDRIRNRGGVAMPPLTAGLDQASMRDKIRHERRIELAFEDHRYWDLKRWMLAEEVLGAPIKGVEITQNTDLTFNYQVIDVENRVFEPKMYFYPIPQREIFVTGWDQNPLW